MMKSTMMKSWIPSLMMATVALAVTSGPALGQTVTSLGTYTGTEGDQWHLEYAPGQRIQTMTFRHVASVDGEEVTSDVESTLIRPIKFLATDSGTTTNYEEQTICLDAGAYADSNTLTPGTEGGDDYRERTPVENHVCQNEHTIEAYSQPAVVSCTATNYALDCASESTQPDTVRFSVVSIDNNCRNAWLGVEVLVTFTDDSTEKGRWNLIDDDLLVAPDC